VASTSNGVRARFAGRTCLVTGGGRGIGRAIALGLAAEGANVGVVARTRDQCEDAAAEIGERGLAIAADVSVEQDGERAVAELEARFGPPSVLVNAAGISPVRQRAEAHDPDAFRRMLDVNLVGAYLMTRAAAGRMLGNGGGSVVMIASIAALSASPRIAGYGASKAGLVQLTRTLAREWADRGVRVNAVCPGYIETQMTGAMLAVPHLRESILAETPLGRVASLAEVVAPTLFLASDEASYVTGAALPVDGGMTA
jgi:NAD(P)-dependent dehydrogenase (short-subunit alcohol dehydrogenase family)